MAPTKRKEVNLELKLRQIHIFVEIRQSLLEYAHRSVAADWH